MLEVQAPLPRSGRHGPGTGHGDRPGPGPGDIDRHRPGTGNGDRHGPGTDHSDRRARAGRSEGAADQWLPATNATPAAADPVSAVQAAREACAAADAARRAAIARALDYVAAADPEKWPETAGLAPALIAALAPAAGRALEARAPTAAATVTSPPGAVMDALAAAPAAPWPAARGDARAAPSGMAHPAWSAPAPDLDDNAVEDTAALACWQLSSLITAASPAGIRRLAGYAVAAGAAAGTRAQQVAAAGGDPSYCCGLSLMAAELEGLAALTLPAVSAIADRGRARLEQAFSRALDLQHALPAELASGLIDVRVLCRQRGFSLHELIVASTLLGASDAGSAEAADFADAVDAVRVEEGAADACVAPQTQSDAVATDPPRTPAPPTLVAAWGRLRAARDALAETPPLRGALEALHRSLAHRATAESDAGEQGDAAAQVRRLLVSVRGVRAEVEQMRRQLVEAHDPRRSHPLLVRIASFDQAFLRLEAESATHVRQLDRLAPHRLDRRARAQLRADFRRHARQAPRGQHQRELTAALDEALATVAATCGPSGHRFREVARSVALLQAKVDASHALLADLRSQLVPAPFVRPEQLIERVTQMQRDLAAAQEADGRPQPLARSPEAAALGAEFADLRAMLDIIMLDATADGLLWRQIEVLLAAAPELRDIGRALDALAPRLAAECRRRRRAQRRRARSGGTPLALGAGDAVDGAPAHPAGEAGVGSEAPAAAALNPPNPSATAVGPAARAVAAIGQATRAAAPALPPARPTAAAVKRPPVVSATAATAGSPRYAGAEAATGSPHDWSAEAADGSPRHAADEAAASSPPHAADEADSRSPRHAAAATAAASTSTPSHARRLAAYWQDAPEAPQRTPELVALVVKHIDRGTFPDAWASAVHHFRKHAPRPDHGTLADYIAAGLAAQAQWQHEVQRRFDSSELLRVVDTPTTFLVFTAAGKILTFRDRRQDGRRAAVR